MEDTKSIKRLDFHHCNFHRRCRVAKPVRQFGHAIESNKSLGLSRLGLGYVCMCMYVYVCVCM